MDETEFRRRVEVYIEADFPELGDAAPIAEKLAPRLYQYVRQPAREPAESSPLLETLLPEGALLFFSASWDGNSQRYRPTVVEAAHRSDRPSSRSMLTIP